MARDSAHVLSVELWEAEAAEADVVVGLGRRKCQTRIVALGVWRSFEFSEPRVGVL